MKPQNEIFQFWLLTGKKIVIWSQPLVSRLPATGAAFIAPLIRCDIFSLWVFCPYLKRPTQGTLLKSAEACEYARMHLCEWKGENGFFIFWESGGFILQELAKGGRRCRSHLKRTAVPSLLGSPREPGLKQALSCFYGPLKWELLLLLNSGVFC